MQFFYKVPKGFVYVEPNYTEKNQKEPVSLISSIRLFGINALPFYLLKDNEIKDLIKQMYNEMLPEFDEAARSSQGCIKDCVIREHVDN